MATIKARSVGRSSVPRYPSRLEVDSMPELLLRYQPPAWLGRKEIAGALAACLAVGANGCSSQSGTKTKQATAAVVAPIFEHGEGRAATGCVVANPPTFLSEEEALGIIREQLLSAGLDLSRQNVVMADVIIPDRRPSFSYEWITDRQKMTTVEVSGKGKPLELDLQDPGRKVAVEYISHEDYFVLGGTHSMSTVQSYDFKELAGSLKNRVEKDGEGVYLGVFYTPCSRVDPDELKRAADERKKEIQERDGVTLDDGEVFRLMWKERTRIGEEASREQLRLQVKDFVDWLKAQGVI